MTTKNRNLFHQKMIELGFHEVTDFVRSTDVDLSFETARRAIYDNRQNMQYEHIVILMQALDFTPQEIVAELKRRGDRHLHRLVLDSTVGVVLSEQEKDLINRIRAAQDPVKVFQTLSNVLNLCTPMDPIPKQIKVRKAKR